MKKKCSVVKVFAIIGVIAAVGVAVFALYKHFRPDYLDEYDDELEDDDFFDEEDEK